jgi:hypothetical protein
MPFTRDQLFAFICGCAHSWDEDINDSWNRACRLEDFIAYINNKISYFGLDDITQDELKDLLDYIAHPIKAIRNGTEGYVVDDDDDKFSWFVSVDEEGCLVQKRIKKIIIIGDDDDLFEALMADAQQAENEKAIQALEEEPDTCEQCGRTDRLDHYWWIEAKKEKWILCEDCGVKEQQEKCDN